MSFNEGQMLGLEPLHKMCSEKEALPFSSGGPSGVGVGTVCVDPLAESVLLIILQILA